MIGVLSSFTGPKVGFTDEVLNNLARTKQQYRAIASSRFTSASLAGLKGSHLHRLRRTSRERTQAGTRLRQRRRNADHRPGVGIAAQRAGGERSHPRFAIRSVGKGAIALATTSFSDPYVVPNDAVVLVSHRQDIVRFFNGGAITPCLYTSPDKQHAALQTVFYSLRPVEDTSIWVKGAWRGARLRTWNQPQPQNVKLEVRDTGVEMHCRRSRSTPWSNWNPKRSETPCMHVTHVDNG